jgi:5-methylcytosine-specific restriction endonuclease McrA
VSQHHRRQKWSTHSPKLRKKIAPRLPLPCLNCPHPVMPTDTWQVGHVIDASRGGRAVIGNAGPSHAWCPTCKKRCNQVAGGRLGATVTNSRRQARKDIRPW